MKHWILGEKAPFSKNMPLGLLFLGLFVCLFVFCYGFLFLCDSIPHVQLQDDQEKTLTDSRSHVSKSIRDFK